MSKPSSSCPNYFKIIIIWSFWPILILSDFNGVKGKQLSPGAKYVSREASYLSKGYTLLIALNMMHPNDQMSAAMSYFFSIRTISGARYCLVQTCEDIDRILLTDFSLLSFSAMAFLISYYPIFWMKSSWAILSRNLFVKPEPMAVTLSGRVLERPKSHTFTCRVLGSIRMFAGFKSRWITLALWMKSIQHKML